MSLRKHELRIAASSPLSGGTSRVFTAPLRGALAMTAKAQRSARSAEAVRTVLCLLHRISRFDVPFAIFRRQPGARQFSHSPERDTRLRGPSPLWTSPDVIGIASQICYRDQAAT